MDTQTEGYVLAENPRREVVYMPDNRPKHAQWAYGFDYGNGDIGLTFKETVQGQDELYRETRYSTYAQDQPPVSYSSTGYGSADRINYQIYLKSPDCGKTWTETGRCRFDEGFYASSGAPDGRIISIGREQLTTATDHHDWQMVVRESVDGGSSWSTVNTLLRGMRPYIWRIRRLRDNTLIVVFYVFNNLICRNDTWLPNNAVFPDNVSIGQESAYFLASGDDGRTFSGPYQVLPEHAQNECDFVELADGRLLFVGGDHQHGNPVRQFIHRRDGLFIPGYLMSISGGDPAQPDQLPRSGSIPECLVLLDDGTILGSRRGKPYSVSNDLGDHWYQVEGLPPSLYQPTMLLLPDGSLANFGHSGSDAPYGQFDMHIGADYFSSVRCRIPQSASLALERMMSADGTHLENAYVATLTAAGAPVVGAKVIFRVNEYWLEGRGKNQRTQEEALCTYEAITDEKGRATATISAYDNIADIHFYYRVDAVFVPGEGDNVAACRSVCLMTEPSLVAHKRSRYPHDVYFIQGQLHLSPQTEERFPDLFERLRRIEGLPECYLPEGALTKDELTHLEACGVITREEQGYCWIRRVHAPQTLQEVRHMNDGDWYV
jgi:hypothetical protein